MELFTLIPIKNIVYIFALFFCLIQISLKRPISNIFVGIILALLITIIFSFPPVDLSAWWSDRTIYASWFLGATEYVSDTKDFMFGVINSTIRVISDNYTVYFFIIASMYTFFYLLSCINFTNNKGTLTMFLMILSSLFFVPYGFNTIRAGLAMSMLILALSCYNKNRIIFVILALCAINIHQSVTLTLASFLTALLIKKPKMCFTIWLISIILSFSMGSYFESLFIDMFEDNRANNYLLADAENSTYNVGFRWDFIIYSMIPILTGYYYIYKRKYNDSFYNILYCTYLLANTFWILVIRANFTDRFAYLSWALMPILLIYPLVNGQLFKHQNYVISLVVLINVAFTFILSL